MARIQQDLSPPAELASIRHDGTRPPGDSAVSGRKVVSVLGTKMREFSSELSDGIVDPKKRKEIGLELQRIAQALQSFDGGRISKKDKDFVVRSLRSCSDQLLSGKKLEPMELKRIGARLGEMAPMLEAIYTRREGSIGN